VKGAKRTGIRPYTVRTGMKMELIPGIGRGYTALTEFMSDASHEGWYRTKEALGPASQRLKRREGVTLYFIYGKLYFLALFYV